MSIRIEATTLMFFDPDTRELLRTRPNPLTYDQARKLRGAARPAHGKEILTIADERHERRIACAS